MEWKEFYMLLVQHHARMDVPRYMLTAHKTAYGL